MEDENLERKDNIATTAPISDKGKRKLKKVSVLS